MKYPNIVEFEITGDYGLFTDPMTRIGGEKCSYQIPTYEALKGILSSVYWKPTIIWYIDALRVMNPIQTETKGIRKIKYNNEKKKKTETEDKGVDLSYYTYLKNCRYQVRAHFEWNMNRPELEKDRNENKHHNIAKQMIEKGGRRDIFLGARECQGYVVPCVFGEGEGHYDNIPELNFGLMYHGITYADEAYDEKTEGKMTVNLWRAEMKNGIVKFLRPEECPYHKTVHDMEMKIFDEKENNFSGLKEFGEAF